MTVKREGDFGPEGVAEDKRRAAEDAEHARLVALAVCPLKAALGFPGDRCPQRPAAVGGCPWWVDRGGWAVGCSAAVVAVGLARGLSVTSYNLEP